jgi:hypothetical protein
MHYGMVMKTERIVTYGLGYKLDIFISEGIGRYFAVKPIEIDPKRLVLPLSMLIVLIYTISLYIKPSIKLNIYNQCLNVDLISPTYIINDDLKWYRPPNHTVCTGDTMRTGFIVHDPGNESGGALIYRLQRKQSHEFTEMSEDTSDPTHILMVWEISRSNELFADVLLLEHNKRFDKDDLKDLYHKNINRFRLFPYSVTEIWSLYDNITLMTTFEIMNRGRILNINISEVKKDNNTRMPVHIDQER